MLFIPLHKKWLAALVAIIVLSQIMLPLKIAHAIPVVVTGDTSPTSILTSVKSALSAAFNAITSKSAAMQTFKEYVLDPLAYIAAQTLIRTMTNQMLGWIQGKDNSGFVENLEDELFKAADAEGGALLNSLLPINMCGNIGAFLQLSLRAPVSLRQRLECTLTDIVENVENFYNDFEQGGWPAFIGINLRPQNNPYGAYLIALDAKIEAETKRQRATETNLLKGKGFLGFRVPRETNCQPLDPGDAAAIKQLGPLTGQKLVEPTGDIGESTASLCDITYDEKTPGTVFADSLSGIVGSDQRRAELADEINEGISQIVFAFLQQVITASTGGGGGIFGSDSRPKLAPLSTAISPAQAGFAPTYLTDRTDDLALRLQATQQILDDGIARIKDLDKQITAIEAELARLQAACDEEKKQRGEEELCSQQGQINNLNKQLAGDSETPGLNTRKSEQMTHLQRVNNDLASLLTVRNSILKAIAEADATRVQNLNTQLSGITGDAEQMIQTVGGPVTGLAGENTVLNFIAMIDKARDRAAGMPAFLEQKIAAEPATATKATLTTLKGDIARLSEDLTRLRADEPLPTDEAASKINALDNNIFKAYSL